MDKRHNQSLQLTVVPLRSTTASELGRYLFPAKAEAEKKFIVKERKMIAVKQVRLETI